MSRFAWISAKVVQQTYAWETFASTTKPPIDSASVAVLDGCKSHYIVCTDFALMRFIICLQANIFLTPFRTQNIPPPMSSYRLSVPSPGILVSDKRTPIHASFSPTEDVLAVLWEVGYVELWNLQTRIEPAGRKVMAPTLIWNGRIHSVQSCRQIAVTTGGTYASYELLAQVTILGSDSNAKDIATVVELGKDSSVKTHDIRLPYRNGRLIISDETMIWQGPDGQIFEGEELPNC